MRPTALTGGAAAVAAVLVMIGLAFDTPVIAGAAGGLAALLSVRAVLFLSRAARFADALEVTRTIEKEMVQQGIPIEVETRVPSSVAQGLTINMADLPPGSTGYAQDGPTLHDGRARYRVRFLVPGEVRFRGVVVRMADPFFTTEFQCTAPRYEGNPITVLPSGASRIDCAAGMEVDRVEVDRKAILRGQEVAGFRPFRPGDDRGLVDWKLSAKHGRPFVREMTGLTGGAALLVIDLPAGDAPGTAPLLAAAGDAIEQEMREFGQCSLVVVNAAEVVAWRLHDRDISALVRLLVPFEASTVVPVYRGRDPIFLRQRLRAAEDGDTPYSHTLAQALRGTLTADRPRFEQEMAEILAAADHQEVIVYSAAAGDCSHLNLLATAIRRQGRNLCLRIPDPRRDMIRGLGLYGRVEAL